MERLSRLISWAQRNERHLGAVLFVFGFGGDILTFAALPLAYANLAFITYLAVAVVCTVGTHMFFAPGGATWRRVLSVICPLGAQFAIGSLLSGCLIFYTKSAALLVSWPFLLFLAVIFIGNEWFRTYYKHLAFQIVLLFFGIYAYAIFALPILVHHLGTSVFLASTALSLAALAAFVALLWRMRPHGLKGTLRYAVPATTLIVALMCVSYFTGLIPPIPLTMPSSGIYHDVQHQGGTYMLLSEGERPWWDMRSRVVHHVAGTPLYAFSSVSAPTSFGASVVHVWEWYDPSQKRWVFRNRISFPITGGRDAGYRGYSEVADPEPGSWRVTIETEEGQVVGRIAFSVVPVPAEPTLVEITK